MKEKDVPEDQKVTRTRTMECHARRITRKMGRNMGTATTTPQRTWTLARGRPGDKDHSKECCEEKHDHGHSHHSHGHGHSDEETKKEEHGHKH